MRRRMKDYLGTVLTKYRVKTLSVTNRAYLYSEIKAFAVSSTKLLLYIVGVILINIKYYQLLWLTFCYLP